MFIVCLYLPFPGGFFHFGSQLFIFYIFSAGRKYKHTRERLFGLL